MTPMQFRSRRNRAVASFCKKASLCKKASIVIAAAALFGAAALPRAADAGEIPIFAVDASWPKPLPNNWILGQVGGITVDWQGHIWVIHRPRSLTDDEKGATLTPPRSKCCASAPPVLEFDTDGNLLRSWGGPGEGYRVRGGGIAVEIHQPSRERRVRVLALDIGAASLTERPAASGIAEQLGETLR